MKVSFQKLGHIPIVSTVSGLARIFRGIGRIFSKNLDEKVKSIAKGTHVVWKNFRTGEDPKTRDEYSHENAGKYSHIKNGFRDVGRGLVEAIPIIGNLAVIILDRTRHTDLDDFQNGGR